MKKSIALALMILAIGCKGKGGDAGGDVDPGDEFMAKAITGDVPKIKEKLAAGKANDATFDCAQVDNLKDARKVKSYAALLDEYEKLCTIDQPIGVLKEELAKIEPARKAKPDEKVLTECFDAYIDLAYDQMTKYKTADKAKEYMDKFATLCPEEAKQTLEKHR
ncbi:hypothetical protein BH11MYX2_BH11MYX2_33280 [soil metagenome]